MSFAIEMRYLFLVITVVFISACSRLELALDFAPRVIANNLDDTFDFSSERYSTIKKSIENDIRQNKKEAVAEIVKGLDQLLILSEKNKVSKADFESNINDLKVLQRKAIGFFTPSITEIISSLSKKEFDHMKEVTEQKFAKTDERLLDPNKFKKHALESFKKNMDLFFDDITDEQLKIYETFIENNYEYYKLQIDFRKDFLKKFEERLDNKPELLSYTLKYYSGDDSVKPADFVKKQKQFFSNANQLQTDIWNSTTDNQKIEFKKTMNELKQELLNLVKENN